MDCCCGISLHDRMLTMTETHNTEVSNNLVRNMRLQDEAFEYLPVAQIVVEVNGNLVLANRQARLLFSITSQDLGCPFQDVQVAYRPVELRSHIQQTYAERRSVQLNHVEFSSFIESNSLYLDIEIIPLIDNNAELLGVLIVFQDATRYNQLQQELIRSTHDLEITYEELLSTNEELLSTNEELETTNAELLYTNEELETMNEELQSTNKELQNTNEELRDRTNELNQANAFLKSILTSLRMGMVVLDNCLSIKVWNSGAAQLWGWQAEEVLGLFFGDLEMGLPVEELWRVIHSCQSGVSDHQELTLNTINRCGKAVHCRILCTPLIIANQHQGLILLIEDMAREQ